MALKTDSELIDSLEPRQAVTLSHKLKKHYTDDICDTNETLYANIQKLSILSFRFEHPLCQQKNSLVILHLIIRSLHKNFGILNELQASVTFVPDLICLKEGYNRNRKFSCLWCKMKEFFVFTKCNYFDKKIPTTS